MVDSNNANQRFRTLVKASYAGGDTITLTGSGFAEPFDGLSMRGKRKKKNQIYYHDETARNLACDHLSVLIGSAEALILTCSDTVIEARLPYSGAGTSPVSVFVDAVGYATKAQSQGSKSLVVIV